MPAMLGKLYRDGEYIIRQGETGDCMYVLQSGEVEVVRRDGGREYCLAVLGAGEFFGEMALVERDVRVASVRALGDAQVLTLDKSSFLRQVHQDPSLAFRLLEKMSERIRHLNERLVNMSSSLLEDLEREHATVDRPH
ncbi:MAG TPA: cyclic nucleotide-binding domain-containing protein [Terriglobales bacterium]|nr:cyclic nucleotide-binding domain-containing protein [Terriglobales bacterium]